MMTEEAIVASWRGSRDFSEVSWVVLTEFFFLKAVEVGYITEEL